MPPTESQAYFADQRTPASLQDSRIRSHHRCDLCASYDAVGAGHSGAFGFARRRSRRCRCPSHFRAGRKGACVAIGDGCATAAVAQTAGIASGIDVHRGEAFPKRIPQGASAGNSRSAIRPASIAAAWGRVSPCPRCLQDPGFARSDRDVQERVP